MKHGKMARYHQLRMRQELFPETYFYRWPAIHLRAHLHTVHTVLTFPVSSVYTACTYGLKYNEKV